MNKFALLAAFALIAVPFAAQANEHGHEAKAMEAAPAVTETASAVDVVVEMKEVTLKDGTKVVIEGEMVSVVGADGTKTAAPDGEHELADGSKVTVKEGKLVPAAVPVIDAPVSDAPVKAAE